MSTAQRAIVLSQLRLGPAAPGRLLRELRDRLAAEPPWELIVAGGLFQEQLHGPEGLSGPVLEGLAVLGQAAAQLTLLPGPEEPGLNEPLLQRRLQEALGRTVSFGEELRPGVLGACRVADEGRVWVTGGALDPTAGLSLDELLGWRELRSFVRAWARQLELRRQLPPPTGPQQLMAQVLARAVYEVAQGREDRALGELLQYLGRRGERSQEVQKVLASGEVLLREAIVQHIRDAVDDAAVAVVVGSEMAYEASEEAPTVVLTGSAAGERPTWVEIVLGQRLQVQLCGLRPPMPAPPRPEGAELAPQGPPAEPPAQGASVQLARETPPPTAVLGQERSVAEAAEPRAAEPDIPVEGSGEMAVPTEQGPPPSRGNRRSRRSRDA
ncbi:MAG: hypothetical protein RMK29_01240 [Myxococcales bacterium]|nr:hypothetical protein [Myxococcota bacterium]MDW8280302.1 hypothetical protein [Myxococcales bacterium]